MLYSKEAAQANIRNRDGKRVFYLGKGDQLSMEARDFLNRERIEILPAEKAKVAQYRLLNGGFLTEKPEHMTHLRADVLVVKNHPRILFRGAIDRLEAELLLCQKEADGAVSADLEQALTLARNLIRWEVMEEPVPDFSLGGMTAGQLRERSHRPQDFYHQPHFMPSASDSRLLLQLNMARCAARQAELTAVSAFTDIWGNPTRTDILQALNRLSSFLYILMIQLKSKG